MIERSPPKVVRPMLLPIKMLLARAEIEKKESDVAYFNALMYAGEVVLKLVVSGLVAALKDDRDRNKYRLEYQLVRADGLGTWNYVLDDLITGKSYPSVDHHAQKTCQELSQRVSAGSWQAKSLFELSKCLQTVKLDGIELTEKKVQGHMWFKEFTRLRNGTRGHGAPTASEQGRACQSLSNSINRIVSNISLFSHPWMYLTQTLSGKLRITPWNERSELIGELSQDSSTATDNGVYILLDCICKVTLLESNPEGSDFWLLNGGFGENKYEMISHLSNDRLYKSSKPYMRPVEVLPPSETEGMGELDVKNQTHTNIPEPTLNYISRLSLEQEIERELRNLERHFIVTLTGSGGIGKTSTALQVISNLIESCNCPYEVVIWFSARDIDLLISGPKAVKPKGLSIDDFALEFTNLIGPRDITKKGFKPREFLAKHLTGDTEGIGPILFVFDNFETTTSPAEVFNWLDEFTRSPNKVLITSRHREFTGDREVRVSGMTRSEAEKLVTQTAKEAEVEAKLSKGYREELISQSNGHPYVIKLMIGELVRGSSQGRPERIMAAQEEVLLSLFDRSYERLSLAAKRVFLTLCRWNSSVPAIAVEAVILRPVNEWIDVQGAISELVQRFLVYQTYETETDEAELSIPLAARLYGTRKLDVSEWQASIEADVSFLHLWGARKRGYTPELGSRIEGFFNNVAKELANNRLSLKEVQPILEFLTTRVPYASVLMARLVSELYNDSTQEEKYLMKYVEGSEHPKMPARYAWKRIANIRMSRDDYKGELHAHVQSCRYSKVPPPELSNTANKINNILSFDSVKVSREEKQFLIKGVVDALLEIEDELNSTDFSRLAWLQLHLDEKNAARQTVAKGLKLDPDNQHCIGLKQRLSDFH
ncbi:MAG: ATP-binding protein [Gemmatimonadetes bacterium]|nr:ATP-binding protein [Gemmatimonadota bacterium]